MHFFCHEKTSLVEQKGSKNICIFKSESEKLTHGPLANFGKYETWFWVTVCQIESIRLSAKIDNWAIITKTSAPSRIRHKAVFWSSNVSHSAMKMANKVRLKKWEKQIMTFSLEIVCRTNWMGNVPFSYLLAFIWERLQPKVRLVGVQANRLQSQSTNQRFGIRKPFPEILHLDWNI